MNSVARAIAVALIQATLVCSLGAKLLYDRATCPRVWVKATPYDPSTPIRGRYLSLMLVPEPGAPYFDRISSQRVVFFVPENRTAVERLQFDRNARELWAEVTIPRKGPPRPIRLGIKKDGQIEPADLR